MKAIKTLLLFTLLLSTNAGAWIIDANFEGGKVGDSAKASNAFSQAFQYSKYSDSVVHTGSRSSIIGIDKGDTGFGEWGGSFKFPQALREGDEVWYRAYIFFPQDFNLSAGGVGLKTMRIHVQSSSGSNEGYLDLLISGDLTVGIEFSRAAFTATNLDYKNRGVNVTKGTWHAYEQYVKFSSVPGQGIYRVWQDGKLVLDDNTTKTLKGSGSSSGFVYLFGYWNDGAPKTQSAYIDDIFITNERPSQRDANGNPMIGLTSSYNVTSSYIAPPQPPTIE